MSASRSPSAALQRRAVRALAARRLCESAEWPPASVLAERDGELEVIAGMPNLPQARRWADRWTRRTGEAPLYLARTAHGTRPIVHRIVGPLDEASGEGGAS